jgi:AcrR family transcriptional regulator
MESRQRVLDAARASFAQNGYERTSVRAIAAAANADQSMVFYFFGSKQKLFNEAMRLPEELPEDLEEVFGGPLEGLGARLLRMFVTRLDASEDVSPLVMMTRSAATNDPAAAMLREFLDRAIVDRVVDRLGSPDAPLRMSLISAQILGLGVARYIVKMEPVASASVDDVVALYAPAIQHLLTLRSP